LGGASFGGGGGPGGFAGAPGAAGFGGAAATGGFAGAAGAGGAAGLPGVSPGGVPPEAEGEAEGATGVPAGFSASAGRGGCFSSESLVMSPKGVQKLHSCQALAAPKFRAHTHKSGANRTVTSNTRHNARQPRKKNPGRLLLPGKPRSLCVAYTHSSAPLR
jgi:hypothetical protein